MAQTLTKLPSSWSAAKSLGSRHYFTGKPCKRGHVEPRQTSNGWCIECGREKGRHWSKSEKGKASAINYSRSEKCAEARRVYQRSPKFREYARRYNKTEKMRVWACDYVARRNAQKLNATPSWLADADLEKISTLYTEAARLTEATGIPHHVDHRIPLQGRDRKTKQPNVCGLHVPENLQIITGPDNLTKGGWWDWEKQA